MQKRMVTSTKTVFIGRLTNKEGFLVRQSVFTNEAEVHRIMRGEESFFGYQNEFAVPEGCNPWVFTQQVITTCSGPEELLV